MLLSCSWVYVLSAGVGKNTFMFCFGRHFLQAWGSLLEGSNITAGSWICDFCMNVYWVWLSLWISLTEAQCAKSNISRCVHEDVSRWHKHWKQEKHLMKPTTLPNSQSDKNFITAFPEIQFPEGTDHGLLSVPWLQELIHTHFPLPCSYWGLPTSVKYQACRWSILCLTSGHAFLFLF